MDENRFTFVVPMFDASKTLARMLHSVCGQSYSNWKIILIDDVSNKEEIAACKKILSNFNLIDNSYLEKIKVIWNTEKKWEVANVLSGIKLCDDNDIICRLDADDCLSDLDALSFLNQVYKQSNFKAIWTAHRWNVTDRNISGPMPENADPYKFAWVSSHLKSFRKSLLNNVPFENFTNMNGEIVKRAGDRAIYLPCLHKAGKLRGFLPRVFYHYHINEKGGTVYQTEDAKFQKQEADFISARGYISSGESWEQKI